jgi:hypothetical protein
MNHLQVFLLFKYLQKNIQKIKGGLIHALMMNHDAASP